MELHVTRYGYLAHWHFSQMARQIFLTCLVGLLFNFALGQTIIVGWNFEDRNAIADEGITGNLSHEITSNSSSTVNYVTGSGGAGTYSTNNINWDNGQNLKYWQISFSSQGYKNLTISSKQYSSNTGPRDFKINYSLDGSTWYDTGAIINIAANFTKGVLSDFNLSTECYNQPLVYIRWTMNSNIAVNGSSVGSTGSNRIDDILIKGCTIPELTSSLTKSICSGTAVNYLPAGPGTIYQWSRSSVDGILELANSGIGEIAEILTNTTKLPVEVSYIFDIDPDGCSNRQTVEVTVNPTPDLLVEPNALITCPAVVNQSISFSNPNQLAGTTFLWEWTGLNNDRISISPSNGTASPINISISNVIPSSIITTSVQISATSPGGCSTNRLVTISSGDDVPPTFKENINNHSFCVQDILEATCNGTDDISEPRPDYFTLNPKDTSLDPDPANFIDNCTPSNQLTLYWRIDFDQNPVSITGTGQPSATSLPIVFPGNSENIVNHHITYWLVDKYGNMTPPGMRPVVSIAIHPRPPIVQNF